MGNTNSSRHQPDLPNERSTNIADSDDAPYLRLTLAILYRAGLDAADKRSPHCAEAREFLQSDFAKFARSSLLQNAGAIGFAPAAYGLSAFNRLPAGDEQE